MDTKREMLRQAFMDRGLVPFCSDKIVYWEMWGISSSVDTIPPDYTLFPPSSLFYIGRSGVTNHKGNTYYSIILR